MSWIDPRLWGALLLAVALSFGAGYWKGHRDADQSATIAAQAKQIKDLASANDLYRQTTQTLSGISQKAKNDADTARAAARTADVAADGLRKRVADLVAAAKRTSAAGGSSPADGGTDPLDLLARLLSRTDDAAGRIAEFADAAHIAGLACERSYGALTKSDDQAGRK